VVVLDGDGSLLMQLGSLATIAAARPRGPAVPPAGRGAPGEAGRAVRLRDLGIEISLPISAGPRYNRLVARPSLLDRYATLLVEVVAELRREYGRRLVAVAVFGSVGRGTPREDSDVDLLIVARDLPEGRVARVEQFLPVEERLAARLGASSPDHAPVMLAPVFKTPAEVERGSPLFLDMTEDARILYDDESFLARYFDRLRARLRALGARRVRRGNAWYWELKPDLKPGEVITL
jgi:hypothetical protein